MTQTTKRPEAVIKVRQNAKRSDTLLTLVEGALKARLQGEKLPARFFSKDQASGDAKAL